MRAGVVAAVLSIAASAAADDLETARKQVEALDYRGARATLEASLNGGGNGPAELVELYRMRGEIAAALGDDRAAEDAFRRLLVIRPEARLPDGTAPKIEQRFGAAAASLAGGGRLRVRHEVKTGAAPSVTLVVDKDPLAMVAHLRVTWRAGDAGDTVEAPGETLTVPLPAARRLELTLSALDEHGNRLVMIGSPEEPVVVVAEPAAASAAEPPPADLPHDRPRRRSFVRRWPLWGGLALACAGAGVVFGREVDASEDRLREIAAESAMHTFGEAQDEIDHGRRMALFANVAFSLAAASGVAAAWFFFDERRDRPTVRAVATPGGAAITLSGRF